MGGGKSDPPPTLSALLSYRSVHEGALRELWAPGKISLSIKYNRWILRFYTVWKQEIFKNASGNAKGIPVPDFICVSLISLGMIARKCICGDAEIQIIVTERIDVAGDCID